MKTKHLTLAIVSLLLFTSSIQAQTTILKWAKQMGGIGLDRGQSITVDVHGNVYSTGLFTDTVDFDPGPGTTNLISAIQTAIYIQKLDIDGNLLWAKKIGGTSTGLDRALDIITDNYENVYTTGFFHGTMDFDPGPGVTNLTSAGEEDVFVQKLDSNGDFVWAKKMGSTGEDISTSIAIDKTGNIFTTGYFEGTVDFDPGTGVTNLSAVGFTDAFVQKISTNGDLIWVKQIGGNYDEESYSIATDDNGNVYTTGEFDGTVDFDPGPLTYNFSSTTYNTWIQKLDSNGNLVWAKRMIAKVGAKSECITVDANSNVITIGKFRDTVDFDPGPGVTKFSTPNHINHIYIQKLDANGNLLWVKQIGGKQLQQGYSCATDTKGNIYATGLFRDTVDFDPGPGVQNLTSHGNAQEIFILKLDSMGSFIWAEQMGGTYWSNLGQSIALDANNSIYTTGYFGNTVDFDPYKGISNLTSKGTQDIFIQKLSLCIPTGSTDDITTCEPITWIDGITYTASNNTATDTFVNAKGCDSIVTLNLIINTVSDLSTSVNGSTLTANNSAATYVWLNCDNNFSTIPGETKKTFTPTKNGSYAVEVTENNCVDTSACVAVYPVGLNPISLTDHFVVYPNPTDGKFTIQFKSPQESINIRILSPEGQEIESKRFQNTKRIQMVLNQTNGIYFLEITDLQSNTSILKLIKE